MDSVALLNGAVFDNKFVILEPLGAGGMGFVYKAKQIGIERIVALKLLNAELVDSDDSAARFEREAKILSLLNHVGIARFFLYGVSADHVPYLAMEYVEGKSLRTELNEAGKFPWQQAVSLLIQVCEALCAAHKLNVIHRDLKPENIMIGCAEKVVLIDFGLSKITDPDMAEVQKLTRTGDLIGSVNYLSPELCKGLRPDLRSDIYAAGVILYEAVSGTLPFVADTPIGVIFKQANDPPTPLNEELLQIPLQLRQVIQKCIAKNPDERYQSADELKEDLKAVLENRSVQIDLADSPSGKTGKFALSLLVCGGIALLVLLGGAGYFFSTHQNRQFDPNEVMKKQNGELERPVSSDNSLAFMSVDELDGRVAALLQKKKKRQALEMVDSWVRVQSKRSALSPHEVSVSAIAKGKSLDYKAALQTYHEALSRLASDANTRPEHLIGLYSAQIDALMHLGKRKLINEPIFQLEKMLESKDELSANTRASIYFHLAQARIDQAKYEEALAFIENDWKDASDKSALYRLKAICLFRLGRALEGREAAIESAKESLAVDKKQNIQSSESDSMQVAREASEIAASAYCYEVALELLETELKASTRTLDRRRALALLALPGYRMSTYLKRKHYSSPDRQRDLDGWHKSVNECIANCEESLAVFSRLRDRIGETHARANLAYYLLLTGDRKRYQGVLDELYALYVTTEKPAIIDTLASILNSNATRAFSCRWYKESADVFREVESLYESLGEDAAQKKQKVHEQYLKAIAKLEAQRSHSS